MLSMSLVARLYVINSWVTLRYPTFSTPFLSFYSIDTLLMRFQRVVLMYLGCAICVKLIHWKHSLYFFSPSWIFKKSNTSFPSLPPCRSPSKRPCPSPYIFFLHSHSFQFSEVLIFLPSSSWNYSDSDSNSLSHSLLYSLSSLNSLFHFLNSGLKTLSLFFSSPSSFFVLTHLLSVPNFSLSFSLWPKYLLLRYLPFTGKQYNKRRQKSYVIMTNFVWGTGSFSKIRCTLGRERVRNSKLAAYFSTKLPVILKPKNEMESYYAM